MFFNLLNALDIGIMTIYIVAGVVGVVSIFLILGNIAYNKSKKKKALNTKVVDNEINENLDKEDEIIQDINNTECSSERIEQNEVIVETSDVINCIDKNENLENLEVVASTISAEEDSEASTQNDENNNEEDDIDELEDEVKERHFVKDNSGKIVMVSLRKSFEAKLIQSSPQLHSVYSVIKNELLSYNKVNSRISWGYDSFNKGRNQVAKLVIRGKSLYLYLALDPNYYVDTKYNFTDESDVKKYQKVPFKMKVKSNLSIKYAKELIADCMEKFDAEQGDVMNIDYSREYEENEPLIERGLIKVYANDDINDGDVLVQAGYGESLKSINVEDADMSITDDIAKTFVEDVEDDEELVITKGTKKAIINIDTIDANFNNGDEIDINVLKEKKLIDKNAGKLKVLARGVLTKSITIKANEYSLQAVKMVVLLGGTVYKVK